MQTFDSTISFRIAKDRRSELLGALLQKLGQDSFFVGPFTPGPSHAKMRSLTCELLLRTRLHRLRDALDILESLDAEHMTALTETSCFLVQADGVGVEPVLRHVEHLVGEGSVETEEQASHPHCFVLSVLPESANLAAEGIARSGASVLSRWTGTAYY